MNWLMLMGLVCLAIGLVEKLGLLIGGAILVALAVLIELW